MWLVQSCDWSGDGCLELLLAAGQNVRLRRSFVCQRAPLSARPGDFPLCRTHESEHKVRECERSQPLVPRVFTTTRYSRSELRRPCCFCQVEFPASELRQHAKEGGRRWLRRKNAVDRRRQSAQRFPCGNKHVQNRGCQPSQAQNNVAVQAAPSQLEVARTSTAQQQSEDGALALCFPSAIIGADTEKQGRNTCWTKSVTVAPLSPEHTQELRGGPSFKSPTMLFSVGTISRQKDTELASRERGQGCPEEGPGHHRRAADGGGAAAAAADEAAEDAADAGHRGL